MRWAAFAVLVPLVIACACGRVQATPAGPDAGTARSAALTATGAPPASPSQSPVTATVKTAPEPTATPEPAATQAPATAPPATPARPTCGPLATWRMSAYLLGVGGPVRVTWLLPGGCPPYTGTLTSSAGLRLPVSGTGGRYDDQPPLSACMTTIRYTLTVADDTGFGWPPLTAIPVTFSC